MQSWIQLSIDTFINKCIDNVIDKFIYCPAKYLGMKEQDKVKRAIVDVVSQATEPLETIEIQDKIGKSIGDVSRSKLMYRLNDLRGEGEIQGKYVGSGKGVWIWWKKQK